MMKPDMVEEKAWRQKSSNRGCWEDEIGKIDRGRTYFSGNLCATLFSDDLSNEPTFSARSISVDITFKRRRAIRGESIREECTVEGWLEVLLQLPLANTATMFTYLISPYLLPVQQVDACLF
jgi:hypothetical protein